MLDLFVAGDVHAVASPSIALEYFRIIEYVGENFPQQLVQDWKQIIEEGIGMVEDAVWFKGCRDPEDNKFINCALSAGAKFVISGDKDLLSLKNVGPVEIVNPKDFLSII